MRLGTISGAPQSPSMLCVEGRIRVGLRRDWVGLFLFATSFFTSPHYSEADEDDVLCVGEHKNLFAILKKYDGPVEGKVDTDE